MNDETSRAIEMLEKRFNERIDAEMRRLAELRAADQLAITVAYEGVSRRMEGFPQQYATRTEQEAIKDTAIRLDRSSISREVYDERHEQLVAQLVQSLPKVVFETTLREWETWRSRVTTRLDQQEGQRKGISALFAWGVAAAGIAVAVVSIILTYHPG